MDSIKPQRFLNFEDSSVLKRTAKIGLKKMDSCFLFVFVWFLRLLPTLRGHHTLTAFSLLRGHQMGTCFGDTCFFHAKAPVFACEKVLLRRQFFSAQLVE